jgi:hypothetical protein
MLELIRKWRYRFSGRKGKAKAGMDAGIVQEVEDHPE